MHDLQPAMELTDAIATPDTIPSASSTAGEPVARALSAEAEVELPSFFIVGPPRTGSSWLYQVLSPHVRLPTPAKETRFFDNHFHRGLKWYIAHYPVAAKNKKLPAGEVAPTYFASARARERLVQALPQARIVCTFRNPAERIVSLYRLKRAYGLIPWNLEQALERDPELMETSRYALNLKLWQRAFGTRNVLAGIYDDLRENPQAFVDGVVDFIGVPRFVLAGSDRDAVHTSEKMTHPRSYYRTRSATLAAEWFKSRRLGHIVTAFRRSPFLKLVLGGGRPFQPIAPELLLKLYERLRPEVLELESLLGRDLHQWKAPARSV
jgi:Sulfotransferase domain